MKQKIEKINWCIIIFTFAIEVILLNFALKGSNISIYSNPFSWIRTMIINVGLDIIYILYILDFINREKKIKNIIKTYKLDANLKFIRDFIILEIIKVILVIISIGEVVLYYQRYIDILLVYVASNIVFYGLYAIMSKKDNRRNKLKRLKKGIKKGKTELKIVLIDGEETASSFDLINVPEYKIAKDNLYINMSKELPKIIKNNSKAEKLIVDNAVAIIHELKNDDINVILNKYEEQKINNVKMYHIMAVKNLRKSVNLEKIEYINSIKICDLKTDIEFVENLFTINYKDVIKKSKYKRAKRYVKKNIKNEEKYMKKLEVTYKYNFNNRWKGTLTEIPKEKYMFELYRNAYLNSSPYQSILTFFNYITVIGKLVEYYLFAKYNPNFDENKIYRDIIGDNPPFWNNHILVNIYKHPENILYKNIREKRYKISRDEKILLKFYLSKILNTDIKGEELTYDGLMQLFIDFRNKVEAHGIINDVNVYAVWNLTIFFVNKLNEIFKTSDLECEYDIENNQVKIVYKGEEKVNIRKYVIIHNNYMCFVKDKESYINYFAGEFKPSFVKEGK